MTTTTKRDVEVIARTDSRPSRNETLKMFYIYFLRKQQTSTTTLKRLLIEADFCGWLCQKLWTKTEKVKGWRERERKEKGEESENGRRERRKVRWKEKEEDSLSSFPAPRTNLPDGSQNISPNSPTRYLASDKPWKQLTQKIVVIFTTITPFVVSEKILFTAFHV